VLHRRHWPSTWDNSFGIPFVPHTPILVRCAFSRLDYGSLSLRPVVLLALLSELTGLPSSQRGRLHPGFRRFGRPPRRRISLQCQLGNLHWQDFHLLDHRLASLHYPGALQRRCYDRGHDPERELPSTHTTKVNSSFSYRPAIPTSAPPHKNMYTARTPQSAARSQSSRRSSHSPRIAQTHPAANWRSSYGT
jgi:hypothetical protein